MTCGTRLQLECSGMNETSGNSVLEFVVSHCAEDTARENGGSKVEGT